MSESRDKILVASLHLFARRGYDATSLSMIGEATGLLKGSLVYHFSTKDAIRKAVLDGLLNRWKDVLPAILMAAASGENRFERILGEALGFFLAEPDRARFLLRECLDRPDDLQERYAKQLEPWIAVVADAIDKGKETGEIYATVNTRAYIWQVVLMILSSVALSPLADLMVGEDDPRQDMAEQLSRELIRMAHQSLFCTPKTSLKEEKDHG